MVPGVHVPEGPVRRKDARWLWLVVPPVIAAIASFIGAIFPGGSLYFWSYALMFWALAAVGWGMLFFLRGHRKMVEIAIGPALAVATCAAVAADLPIRVAFAVSEPALSAYVRSLPMHPESVTMGEIKAGLGVEWVGVFPVGSAVRHVGSTDLGVVGSGGWLEFCGLTYSNGHIRASTVHHLSGRWYVTCEAF
jgi:hypothetical protein